MNSIVRSALFGLTFSFTMAACATSGPPTPAAAASADLAGTRWKLLTLGGKMDGRTIEFRKAGTSYVATLVEPGLRLRNAPGVRAGMNVFILERSTSNPNDYSGTFETMDAQGVILTKQVSVSVSGTSLSWTLENATWERIP